MNIVEKLIQAVRETPKNLLIVGDGMTDVYINGQMGDCQERCPKFLETDRVEVVGGARNAGRSLHNWHIPTIVYAPGDSVKTRFMVEGKCLFRYDHDQQYREPDLFQQAVRFELRRTAYSAVLLCDYAKGMLTADFIDEVIEHCTEKEIPCVVDAKRHPTMYAGAILKCNDSYMQTYPDAIGVKQVVVTYGELPPVIWESGEPSTLEVEFQPVQCVNYVGAGDCFAAHLTLALAYDVSIKNAVAIAHAAARCYVQHPYNRPPLLDGIVADLTPAISTSTP